jgi:hypothetical protein
LTAGEFPPPESPEQTAGETVNKPSTESDDKSATERGETARGDKSEVKAQSKNSAKRDSATFALVAGFGLKLEEVNRPRSIVLWKTFEP